MSSPAAEDVAAQTSFVRTAKDLFAGAAGGIAQVLLGKLDLVSGFIGYRAYITVAEFPELSFLLSKKRTHALMVMVHVLGGTFSRATSFPRFQKNHLTLS